jgi:hypothetical protein
VRVASLLLSVLVAQPSPFPEQLAPINARVHLRASEDLDPDRLRSLARKNVTLWLSTRTNTLRASTLETLNRFGETWISLHAPVGEADARQLSKVPTAGLWLDASDLDGARRVLGPRRLAIKLRGPLDEAMVQRLRKLRPSEIVWAATGEIDLLSWGLFRQLPGRKLLVRDPSQAWPVSCPPNPPRSEPALQTGLGSLGFPCGKGPRLELPLETEPQAIQMLLVREPSTELIFDVGEDSAKASRVRRLLDDLGVK